MLRQGASLTTLQTIFDKADYSQRLYGKIRLQAIRKNFSKGKVRNILGHEADPRFWTSHALKYSIAVEEGNYSTTQKQMELQQLLHFRELGMPIGDASILKAAFITNKDEVIKDMQQTAQQRQQMQQMQAQQQEKKDNAEIMEKYSQARSNLAQEKDKMAAAQEKLAKVDELHSKAEHEKMRGDLDLIKMMVELESMDLETIKSSYEIAQVIKMGNSMGQQTPQLTGEKKYA